MWALSKGTARLPETPRGELGLVDVLPRNTIDAMQQGVFKVQGYGVQTLVQKELENRIGEAKDWNIFLTGGAAGLLAPFFPDATHAPNLMMDGMEYLWSRQEG